MNVRLLAAFLSLLALAPAASAGTGPFVGTLRQGETDAHVYDNNPDNHPCIQIVTTYTVALAYAPATDTLTLRAGGRTDVGANGVATVTFQAGICTRFTITVEGTSVADSAAYEVSVTQGHVPDADPVLCC